MIIERYAPVHEDVARFIELFIEATRRLADERGLIPAY